MSDSESSGVISTKKVTTSVASYIWESPCLKPLIFNPFLISLIILSIIWLTDLFYGKTFTTGARSAIIQHIITTYVLVAGGIALNNILIKHHYRCKYVTDKEEKNDDYSETPESYIATYEST